MGYNGTAAVIHLTGNRQERSAPGRGSKYESLHFLVVVVNIYMISSFQLPQTFKKKSMS